MCLKPASSTAEMIVLKLAAQSHRLVQVGRQEGFEESGGRSEGHMYILVLVTPYCFNSQLRGSQSAHLIAPPATDNLMSNFLVSEFNALAATAGPQAERLDHGQRLNTVRLCTEYLLLLKHRCLGEVDRAGSDRGRIIYSPLPVRCR